MTLADTDRHPHEHPHEHPHPHEHEPAPSSEARPPTVPSQSVLLDVGAHAGALVLSAEADRQGVEVEIHPASSPESRTHVWVLPRSGPGGAIVFAAVFPSLAPGPYAILGLDGAVAQTIEVPANQVTYATWE